MSLFRKRIRKVYMTLGFVFIMELGILFYNSGTVVGMNIRADKLKAYAIASRDDNTVSPGNFYDRNGIILTENVMLKKESKLRKQSGRHNIVMGKRIRSCLVILAVGS